MVPLLMISGDRSLLQGRQGAFYATLQEFSRHFDRIDILCPFAGESLESPKAFFGNVHVHPSSSSLLFQPWWIARKGAELIAKYGHEVMTVHEYPPFYNGIGAGMLSQRTGVPAVYEIHHIIGQPHAASLTEWIGWWLSRLFLRWDLSQAQAVRTVNHTVRDTLVRWGVPEQKIAVVPSFYLDSRQLKPDPAVSKEYDVVFCARLAANKGVLETLRAVAALPDVSLLVIGDGPMRSTAEDMARQLQIMDRVTFAGWLETSLDVFRAIQSAKILVMNSKSEGGPRVALEAMALGMPVIVTRVGVMPDVVRDGENGVFTTGAVQDLARQIGRVLNDQPLRERMGKAAQRIVDRFEKGKLIEEYAEFVKRLP